MDPACYTRELISNLIFTRPGVWKMDHDLKFIQVNWWQIQPRQCKPTSCYTTWSEWTSCSDDDFTHPCCRDDTLRWYKSLSSVLAAAIWYSWYSLWLSCQTSDESTTVTFRITFFLSRDHCHFLLARFKETWTELIRKSNLEVVDEFRKVYIGFALRLRLDINILPSFAKKEG